MYCVKCGVELADSEKSCPLCKTPVYYPEHKKGELSFPEFTKIKERVNTRGLYFVISGIFVIAAIVSLFSNWSINEEISWSAYVVGALILGYAVFVLPGWFYRPSPVIFVPVDFAVGAVLLWYIDYSLGGKWFFSFGLPIVGFIALITSSIVILLHYLKSGRLYVWGGALIALAVFMPLLEMLIHINFIDHGNLVWSPYPMITLGLFGILLIVVAIVKPFRESLKKIFSL